LVGFSFLLVPVALILSVVGLFWKESRLPSLIGLVLCLPPTGIFVISMVVRSCL